MCACYFRYTVSVWDLGQSQYWQYLPVHLGTWSSGQNFFFRGASLFLCFLFYKVWLTSKHCKYLRCTFWCFDIRKVHLLRGRWNSIKNFLWTFSSSFLPSSLLPSFASSFISPFLSFSTPHHPLLHSVFPSFLSLLQKDDLNSDPKQLWTGLSRTARWLTPGFTQAKRNITNSTRCSRWWIFWCSFV